MTEIEEVFLEHRPTVCEKDKCDGKMIYEGNGEYICKKCGGRQLDDFGKIRKCLEKQPGLSAAELSERTGVGIEIISMFLKDGRMSIPEGSALFIRCERCGCALRHGRYCIDCTREIAYQLKGAFYENVGEKPKNIPDVEWQPARMRYERKR